MPKVRINRDEFQQAIGIASRCLEKKNTIPILKTFRLGFADNEMSITGTDLDQAVRITMPATCENPDTPFVCVDGRLLSNIVSRLTEDFVCISVKPDKIVVERISGSITLRTNSDQYPNVPLMADEYPLSFNALELQELCKSALLGTAEGAVIERWSDVARLSIERNLIEGKFRCVTSDRKRIAVVTGLCDTDRQEASTYQIPIDALRVFYAVLKDEGQIFFGEDGNHLFAKMGESCYSFRKLAVKFPSIDGYLNKTKFNRSVTVEAERLTQSIDLVGQLIDPRTNKIIFSFNKDLTLTSSSADNGEISESVALDVKFEPFTAAYNINYILPILRQMSGEVQVMFAEDAVKMADGSTRTAYPLRLCKQSKNLTSTFDIQSMTI
jgi:DNA polymerase-3 subunit beta